MMYPYPRTYPNEAVKIIADYLTGHDDTIEKKDAIHAGWVVSGFSLGKIFGGGPAIIGSSKKFKPAKAPKEEVKIKDFMEAFHKANRYGTLNKLEESNPSCWHQLYELAQLVPKV
jgi:hypothetical protein